MENYRYLFWSDNGRHPKIERSDMLGNDRHTIVTKHLVSPLSMEADRTTRRIYWIDSYTQSLLSASYEGEVVNMVTRVPTSTLFDIAIFRVKVFSFLYVNSYPAKFLKRIVTFII